MTTRIERVAKTLRECLSVGPHYDFEGVAARLVEAADTEEPEIVVTDDQVSAGFSFVIDWQAKHTKVMPLNKDTITAIYRAMRPLEPIPPFTDEMEGAMREVWCDNMRSYQNALEDAYKAARALEGKP